ncbi:MAG: 50S ribosomal protein L9 [Francisellaceae bacterium]
MQIILKQRVENLGVLGDVVNVKSGYARNYLIPYGRAVQATKENVEKFEAQKAELMKIEANRLNDAKAKAELIEGKTITIAAQAGDGGKLFGSIGSKEIADAIHSDLGIEMEKRHVRMPEGVIRAIGEFEFAIHLHSDVDATIKVVVIAE